MNSIHSGGARHPVRPEKGGETLGGENEGPPVFDPHAKVALGASPSSPLAKTGRSVLTLAQRCGTQHRCLDSHSKSESGVPSLQYIICDDNRRWWASLAHKNQSKLGDRKH